MIIAMAELVIVREIKAFFSIALQVVCLILKAFKPKIALKQLGNTKFFSAKYIENAEPAHQIIVPCSAT